MAWMTAGCATYDLNTDKGEVGGSSPPRPTIQITSKYAAIHTFPLFWDLPQKTVFVNRLSTSRLAGSHCTQGSPRHRSSRNHPGRTRSSEITRPEEHFCILSLTQASNPPRVEIGQ